MSIPRKQCCARVASYYDVLRRAISFSDYFLRCFPIPVWILIMLLSAPASHIQAQTQWMNNYVTLSPDDQQNPSIARPSHPGVIIAVEKNSENGVQLLVAQCFVNDQGLPLRESFNSELFCVCNAFKPVPYLRRLSFAKAKPLLSWILPHANTITRY